MIENLIVSANKQAIDRLASAAEGRYLATALSAAVPLWILRFAETTNPDLRWTELQTRLKRLNGDDVHRGMNFCELMEYTLHKGPKEGDSASAFNALAESIAIMAFLPGGITAFGQHFEYKEPP